MNASLGTSILVVDDDDELSGMLVERLAQEGWRAFSARCGREADSAMTRLQPVVVVLDVMLPDANGLELCRIWRAARPDLGVLMLTARGDPVDRVVGLELGADDYLSKPFDLRELIARVRALARRRSPISGEDGVIRYPGLSIDIIRREVLAGHRPIPLSGVEFKLLVALAGSGGNVISRESLSGAIQPGGYRPQDRTVDVQVARLRRKLREACPGVEWIDTVRGEGYVFVARR